MTLASASASRRLLAVLTVLLCLSGQPATLLAQSRSSVPPQAQPQPAPPTSQAPLTDQGQKGRSLPFNKQNVYNYFKQVAESTRALPEKIAPDEYQSRVCHLYATTLKQGGYDFEATVQNAVQFGEKGTMKLDDPRFLFLAGVFQNHPDVFLRLGLIGKSTRDAVVQYFK